MSEDGYGRGRLQSRRPGLFFGLLLIAACSQEGAPARDVVQLDEGEVQLPEGARRHDIRLTGVGSQEEVAPSTVAAGPADAIAFTATDAMTHSVVFLGDRLDSAQVAFLERNGQMRGPPLLAEGSSWVVSLEGAPPGDYPFACALHGGQGVIRVGTGQSD